MTHPNRLDLDAFFFPLEDQAYVIIKNDNFPDYSKGSDIDVLCSDKNAVARKILNVANNYLDKGYEIRVVDRTASHTHIDFLHYGELEFRFDLYQSLPDYHRIHLKPHYILSVVENAVATQREYQGTSYHLYRPSQVDEMLLRYVEYIEWYELRPDKIRHLDYLTENIDEKMKTQFLNKLHLYTAFPEYVPPAKSRRSTWKKSLRQFFVKLKGLKGRSFPEIITAALRWAKGVSIRIYRTVRW